MKLAKRGAALLLAVLLMFTSVTFARAEAGTGTVLGGDCGAEGSDVIWSLDTATGVLTISGSGAMRDYNYSDLTPWSKYNNQITSAVIEEGVTSIGFCAFNMLHALKSVTIADSVTSIGRVAFQNNGLTEVTIPTGVTHIDDGAFYSSNLEAIHVAEDNPAYTDVDGVLFTKDMTELVCYPGEKNGTEYRVPDGVRKIWGAGMNWCTKLTVITLPASLETINDGRGDGSFWGCTALNSITVEDENENFCSVDGVLYSKDRTTLWQYPIDKPEDRYEIPDSVTRIESHGFLRNNNLTTIKIGNGITFSDWGHPFYGMEKLSAIEVPEDNEKYCAVDGVLYSKDRTKLIFYPPAKEGTSYAIPEGVQSIRRQGFYRPENLSAITLPSTLTSMEDEAIAYATKLTSIEAAEGSTSFCAVDGVLFTSDKTELVFYPAGRSATSYIVPDGTKIIRPAGLAGSEQLISVFLPVSLTKVRYNAFDAAWKLRDVYYFGTEEQREQINIEDYNYYLTNAAWHYITEDDIHTVTAVQPEDGSVSVTPELAITGDTVKVTAKASRAGYVLDQVIVNGSPISGTSFVVTADMSKEITVTAAFKKPSSADTGKPMLRREVCVLLASYLGLDTTNVPAESPYSDLDPSDPDYGAIVACNNQWIITGYNGQFHPDDTLTRAQMAKVINYVNGSPYPEGTLDPVPEDVYKVWYYNYVCWVLENGVMSVREDGLFYPNEEVVYADVDWEHLEGRNFVDKGSADLRFDLAAGSVTCYRTMAAEARYKQDGVIYTTTGEVTVYQSNNDTPTANTITVNGSTGQGYLANPSKLTIDGLNIKTSTGPCIRTSGGVRLTVKGDNTLIAENDSGITVGSSLDIRGTGKLTVEGYNVGIITEAYKRGNDEKWHGVGRLTISGVEVTATGNYFAIGGRDLDNATGFSSINIQSTVHLNHKDPNGKDCQEQIYIYTQPENSVVVPGGTAVFSVDAYGNSGLNYQWQTSADGGETWTDVAGETGPEGRIPVPQGSDGLYVLCRITNGWDDVVYTNPVRAEVMAFTQQPMDVSGIVGGGVSLSVVVNCANVTYQWQYSGDEGDTWTDVDGASGSTLTLSGARSDSGLYRCVVTTANGESLASDPARVKLYSQTEYEIVSLSVLTADYQPADQIPPEWFCVQARVKNLSSDSTGTLVLAAYDENDQFVGLWFLTADPQIGQTFTLGAYIDNSDGRTKKLKAFVCPALEGMTIPPISLAKAREFPAP